MPATRKNYLSTPTSIALVTLVLFGWLYLTSQGSAMRFVLLAGLGLASFAIGCLVAFLFTSYGEEVGTIGKIRDWLIGGLTGLTIAEAGAVKRILLTFAAGPGASEFALVVAFFVVYSVLGFFVMFFQRELILNVLLAERRAERGRLEGAGEAGIVIQRFLLALPPSILSGVDDIDEVIQFRKAEAEKLHTLLYSSEVDKFLEQADQALKTSAGLDWDVVSKAANLHYYRTYFEKEDRKESECECAHAWIVRALAMNPLHVDLTVKLADVLGMMDRYVEAVSILEKLECTPEAPAYLKQWLGYFLLFVDRNDEAIRYSEEYHKLFPDEHDSIFNIASAYAQKHCSEIHRQEAEQGMNSENRKLALEKLKEALRGEPDYAETVRTKWIRRGESFDCFADDKEFRSIVCLPEKPTSSDETN